MARHRQNQAKHCYSKNKGDAKSIYTMVSRQVGVTILSGLQMVSHLYTNRIQNAICAIRQYLMPGTMAKSESSHESRNLRLARKLIRRDQRSWQSALYAMSAGDILRIFSSRAWNSDSEQ